MHLAQLLPLYGLHRDDPLCNLVRCVCQHEGTGPRMIQDISLTLPAGMPDTTQTDGCSVSRSKLRQGTILPSHNPHALIAPQFFTAYQPLILSPNYVTKRQSLKLLGEILLDRSNYACMTRYIASTENLQVVMNTLRDKSRNIQYEAFHVFKVR